MLHLIHTAYEVCIENSQFFTDSGLKYCLWNGSIYLTRRSCLRSRRPGLIWPWCSGMAISFVSLHGFSAYKGVFFLACLMDVLQAFRTRICLTRLNMGYAILSRLLKQNSKIFAPLLSRRRQNNTTRLPSGVLYAAMTAYFTEAVVHR